MPPQKLPKSWPKITHKLDNLTKINWSEVTRKLDTRNVCRVGRKGDGASTSLIVIASVLRHFVPRYDIYPICDPKENDSQEFSSTVSSACDLFAVGKKEHLFLGPRTDAKQTCGVNILDNPNRLGIMRYGQTR